MSKSGPSGFLCGHSQNLPPRAHIELLSRVTLIWTTCNQSQKFRAGSPKISNVCVLELNISYTSAYMQVESITVM